MAHSSERLDMSVDFQPVNIAVMTISDSRTPEDDKSGDLLVGRIADDGHHLADRQIITDDLLVLSASLMSGLPIPKSM